MEELREFMPITTVLPVAFLLAFLMTYGFTLLLRPLAVRLEWVDKPGGRKHHSQSTPMIGGLAIFLGFLCAAPLIGAQANEFVIALLISAVVLAVGIADDKFDLTPRLRMWLHALSGLALVSGAGIMIQDVAVTADGVVSLSLLLAVPLTVFAVCAAVNAYNMSDGVDGLASAMVMVPLLILTGCAASQGVSDLFHIGALLLAATFGFFCVNSRFFGRKSAAAFLGDAGSTFLGFMVCWLLVAGSQGEQRVISPMTALWLAAVPLIDSAVVIARRIRAKRSPFSASREHLHHLLFDNGVSVNKTVVIMTAMSLVSALAALTVSQLGVSDVWLFVAFLLAVPMHYRLTSDLHMAVGRAERPFVLRWVASTITPATAVNTYAVEAKSSAAQGKVSSLEKAA